MTLPTIGIVHKPRYCEQLSWNTPLFNVQCGTIHKHHYCSLDCVRGLEAADLQEDCTSSLTICPLPPNTLHCKLFVMQRLNFKIVVSETFLCNLKYFCVTNISRVQKISFLKHSNTINLVIRDLRLFILGFHCKLFENLVLTDKIAKTRFKI